MSSPIGPELGRSDAQVDVSKIGTIFGPTVNSGNGRLRHAVAPNVVVEGEAGILAVTNEGTGPSRNGYTGRLGAIWQTPDHRFALTTGVGAGTSTAAGNWAGLDVGGMVTGQHKHVRPVLYGEVGYSGPIGARKTFTVNDDGSDVELRLPRNYSAKAGLAVEFGSQDASLIIGFTFVKFLLRESSRVHRDGDPNDKHTDEYAAVGLGLRFKL